MKPPEILFDLHSGKKSESNPHILKDDFRKMQSRYKNYQQIYTDGSKEDSKVGCAVISDNHSNMTVKLLTEHHLEFLSLKGGCTGSSESTLVKMPHCWKL